MTPATLNSTPLARQDKIFIAFENDYPIMTLLGLACFGFCDAVGCEGGSRSTYGTYKNLPLMGNTLRSGLLMAPS